MLTNADLLNIVRDITVARIEHSQGGTAEQVAQFMQIIYDKLVDLNKEG